MPDEVDAVNVALQLRRPLLVTGPIRSGKASLAYAVAREVSLGPVLRWDLTARSTLAEGVGWGRHLGPLATALLPYERPRVLVITALDHAPLDLPEEVLAALERGEFVTDQKDVRTHDNVDVSLDSSLVRCREFPFVVITSSAEQDHSPSFLRRCVRLRMPAPTPESLAALLTAHLGDTDGLDLDKLVAEYLTRENLGVDQLLNGAHLARRLPMDAVIALWQSVTPEESE